MLLARPEILTDPSVPKGMKMYIQNYAKKEKVLGMEVYLVSTRQFWNHDDYHQYEGKHLGVGPLNHSDYDKFTPEYEDKREGIKPGTFDNIGLYGWIREHERAGGTLIVRLHEVGERHDSDFFSDD
jgi:hypothetical protein